MWGAGSVILLLVFASGWVLSYRRQVALKESEQAQSEPLIAQKKVEEAFRETQAILQAAMEQSPAGIAIADARRDRYAM